MARSKVAKQQHRASRSLSYSSLSNASIPEDQPIDQTINSTVASTPAVEALEARLTALDTNDRTHQRSASLSPTASHRVLHVDPPCNTPQDANGVSQTSSPTSAFRRSYGAVSDDNSIWRTHSSPSLSSQAAVSPKTPRLSHRLSGRSWADEMENENTGVRDNGSIISSESSFRRPFGLRSSSRLSSVDDQSQVGGPTTLWLGDLEDWMDESYIRQCVSSMQWNVVDQETGETIDVPVNLVQSSLQ